MLSVLSATNETDCNDFCMTVCEDVKALQQSAMLHNSDLKLTWPPTLLTMYKCCEQILSSSSLDKRKYAAEQQVIVHSRM